MEDTVAEVPLGTTLRRRRKAQAQIENRWGHRARPQTPDPQGWVERSGRRDGSGRAANPGRAAAPCRFENSRAEAGNWEAPQVLGAGGGGKALREGWGH